MSPKGRPEGEYPSPKGEGRPKRGKGRAGSEHRSLKDLPPGERLEFAAELACLPKASAFVEDFCARHGIARADALRLLLVVEELATNTIVHGYRGAARGTIAVQLAKAPDGVRILYEDAAVPFDPRPLLARDAAAQPAADAAGGFGTRMVGALTHGVRYVHEGGRNRLWLALECRAGTRAGVERRP